MKSTWDFSELYNFAEELRSKTNFDKYAKRSIREVAKELVDVIKQYTPIGETGKLINGWDKRKLKVIPTSNGYEVLLVNDVEYAKAVNDGHYSYNQFNKGGDPYIVRNRTVPYYMGNHDDTFVYGHFFVEKGIAEYETYGNLEQIIMGNLEKWWNGLDG